MQQPDGGIRVYGARGGDLLGEAGTAAEAVALAVAHLPPGLGPAVPRSTDGRSAA
ncbi:DUF6193 family natural product biosynthesis protein [Streptomyces clavifer]|uniref:DUF6193 family natural product biosynthesis protein n=1 Tax=Streptomyces clavifer TaxID=68188 RepID=UPI00365EF5C4